VEQVCKGGIKLVQLRLKDLPKSELGAIAYQVKKVTDSFGALLVINDNPEVAVEVGAYGVHLGMSDMHPKEARRIVGNNTIIGGTANTFSRILELHEYVDYFGVGPFRFTQTKKNLSPVLGIEGYLSILHEMYLHKVRKPVYAIGGILGNDIPTLMETGIHGIAVSSVISKSKAIIQTSQNLITVLNSYNYVNISNSR
jgi:thiamine-phosphate pyrophosphorylase